MIFNGQINRQCIHKFIQLNDYKPEWAKCVPGNPYPAFIENNDFIVNFNLN
jgi:hypothetical protein